ncbi:hypothetical protein TCON_1812 [Astathelohania contejeani]|uniref:Uncharacterized protein n=1 Tax=Astathelohania contejeani TaxID=164912 RepID=A0ABQ7HXS6_9MICR|nr:hypothetical protein TCON_1812 [Thelohania contejeani]
MENERAEIRVDTRIRTDILIKNNIPDIFIYDKKENEIILVEVGITSQDNLQIVEREKKRKYDLLANELGSLYKAKTKIIPYVMTWDGVVWCGNQVPQELSKRIKYNTYDRGIYPIDGIEEALRMTWT